MILGISIVLYHSNQEHLSETINSLLKSLDQAYKNKLFKETHLYIVINSENEPDNSAIFSSLDNFDYIQSNIINNKKNVGYGRGHNLAIDNNNSSSYHLVLNPDVFIHEDAITEAMEFMETNPRVGLLTPRAFSASGIRQYLCKRYPALFDLFIRGFSLHRLLDVFQRRSMDYELQGKTEDNINTDIQIASGCFMFLRSQALKKISGFSPEFFMYFEDFDLSIKLRRAGWQIAYVPAVKITHYGGNASKKGIKHIYLFITSAVKFFNKFGWKMF